MYKISEEHGNIILYATVGLSAVICGVLTYRFLERGMIVCTALFGSYAMVRGISMYAGHYPSEFELIDDLKS